MILALKLSAGYLLKSRWEACFSIKVYFYIITLFCLAAHNYNGSEADSNCEQMCFLPLSQTHLNKSCESHFETWISISAVRKYSWVSISWEYGSNVSSSDSKGVKLKTIPLKRDDDDETKQILWTQNSLHNKTNKSDRLRLFSIFSHFVFLALCVDISWANHFVFNSLLFGWSCNINDTIRWLWWRRLCECKRLRIIFQQMCLRLPNDFNI